MMARGRIFRRDNEDLFVLVFIPVPGTDILIEIQPSQHTLYFFNMSILPRLGKKFVLNYEVINGTELSKHLLKLQTFLPIPLY